MKHLKSIFQYKNYRNFLHDYYSYQKEIVGNFSYQQFAKLACLKSPNYLKLIIDGKRNLTVSNIHQLSHAMKLELSEREFFETLVLFTQSQTKLESIYYGSRLNQLKLQNPNSQIKLKSTHSNLFLDWRIPAMICLIDGLSAEETLKEAKEKLGLSKEEIQNHVSLLKSEGLMDEQDGKYKFNEKSYLFIIKKTDTFTTKNIFRAALKNSLAAFEKGFESHTMKVQNTMFGIESDKFEYYAGRISKFISELSQEAKNDAKEKIVQASLQFYPVELLKK